MKTLLALSFLFTFSVGQPLFAQIFDRSISVGFIAEPHAVRAMPNGQWLVVGRGQPYRGAFGYDTLFAMIFDQQGEVLLKKALTTISAEARRMEDALVLADGGFLVSFSWGDCDAGGYGVAVQKYDPSGQLVWFMEGDVNDGDVRPPGIWKLAPDGNIIGFNYNQVWKVDATTGTVLYKAQMIDLNLQSPLYYFDLIPGTESFAAMGYSVFQVWKKSSNSSGYPIYVLQNSLALDGFQQGLGFAPNGWYYVLNATANQLERINENLEHEVLSVSFNPNGLRQLLATEHDLYWLGRTNEQNWLYKTDFTGQNPVVLSMPDKWRSGYSVAVQGDSVAVVGIDGSGPKSTPGEESYREFQAQQLWLRTFEHLNSTPSTDTINASVTNLQQLSAVDTTFYPAPFEPTFVLAGGKFKVEITNHGPTVLERVYVNFSYEEYRGAICFSTFATQHLYTDLHLASGESTWIDFDSLTGGAQSSLASEFCFWTSSPNDRPDAHHEDDHFCIPVTYTVDTQTPNDPSVQLLPNPAQEFFRILNAANPEATAWQLYDATGRLMQQGIYPASQPELTISTAQLPNGFYIFRMKDYLGKLIVKH